MIDLRTETIRDFRQAAADVTDLRGGRRLHPATLYRWATEGCRGIRLETIRIGGRRFTSTQALIRFFEQSSE
jgi:hypothetical protein